MQINALRSDEFNAISPTERKSGGFEYHFVSVSDSLVDSRSRIGCALHRSLTFNMNNFGASFEPSATPHATFHKGNDSHL